jgi:hypothetical protein
VENRGFEALGAPPKCGKHKNTKGPIYKQNKSCCHVRGAFDRRWYDRSQSSMCSILGATFDVAIISHGTSELVMVARAMRTSRLTWLAFDRGFCVRTQCARSH